MIHISASLIKDYLVCNKRGYYRINHPEQGISSKEMSIGTIVHYILEKDWKDRDVALGKIPGLIKKHNLKTGEDKIYESVENFFKMFPTKFWSEEDEIEKYFKIPYSVDVLLTGKIDRIHDNLVYDWKTGHKPPEDINFDVQFIMYYLCFRKIYNRFPSTLAYVSLPMMKMYYFEALPPVIEEFENKILPEVIEGIKSNNFPRQGLFGYKSCQYCSFNNICFSDLGLE